MISQLGDDLLVQILIRLPDPRPACRCKSVCKRWNSLISTPSFNRRFVHHHRSSNHHLPLPDDPNELQSTIRRLGTYVRDDLRVLDCFKDLVLCGFWDLYNNNNHELVRSYLICNPFTKQWVALPLAPRKRVGYEQPVARLVCEPCNPKKLDLGDDDDDDETASFVYSSEHRFRVVCIYQVGPTTMLDVFFSGTWKWMGEVVAVHDCVRFGDKSVVSSSCDGELFWSYLKEGGRVHDSVAALNPFRFRAVSVDVSAFAAKPWWVISVSQGALHVIALEGHGAAGGAGWRLSVWRLEEDRRSWRKLCEGLVSKKTTRCGKYRVERCDVELCLHPSKPGVVLFNWLDGGDRDANAILSWDLRREEVELFAELEAGPGVCRFMVFQPRVHCWPTSIRGFKNRTLLSG
ncbi:unnamed protein product [Linum tenue]|uniref:F-box domain-containing protein n=1 Tax=Linum tenue TaxID=586396 RepID=A0AAV0QPI7_9ROSI|nr:unnamed protein product [Linum tenue]